MTNIKTNIIIIFLISLSLVVTKKVYAEKNFFNEAKAKYDEKKLEESKFLFQRNIVFNPKDANSYLYLAKIFEEEKNDNEKDKNLNTALLLDPTNEDAMFMLIKSELDKSNYSKVKQLKEDFATICKNLCEERKFIENSLKDIEPKMSLNNSLQKIIIIDFGSQFTQLIARRIRELNVYCEIINHKQTSKIKDFEKIKGFILSGGPLNVYETKKVKFNKTLFDKKIPILGICFGHQLISKSLGGKVKQAKQREFGLVKIKQINSSILTQNFFKKNKIHNVWMSHADEVTKLPKDFRVVAKSENAKYCIIENKKKNFYGIQFHPEVTHTDNGKTLIKNFIFNICKIKRNWTSKNQKQVLIKEVKKQVGNLKVICALSGGVDSSVVAKLIFNAIGKNLTCIFVNTGLLRKNEEFQVKKTFKNKFKINLVYVDAKKIFLSKLKNVTDPEKKKKNNR